MFFVLFLIVPALLVMLALLTRAGTAILGWIYPPQGQFVDVPGARLHVVEIGPSVTGELPIVMIAGANSNLATIRRPLGDMLAAKHHVILIDRPGQGWSTRERLADSTPAIQARMIDQALAKLGIARAIFVGHSWGGAVLPAIALENPQRAAGLVMLAPVTHPWQGQIGTLTDVATMPVIGSLMANTIIMPTGFFLLESGMRFVFYPQSPPDNFTFGTRAPLILRPSAFLSNAWDLKTLKASIVKQAPDYPKIKAPTVVIAGDADLVVSAEVHARAFAKAVPHAKLIILPGVGHMPQVTNAKLVLDEIETMVARSRVSASAK